jgi:hypothetical protein
VTVHRLRSAATRYFSEPSAWQVLLSFENQDLEGLDEASVRVVKRAIDMTTGTSRPPEYMEFEPRLFRKISNSDGEPRYILVEEEPKLMIPGWSIFRAHIFDNAGRVLSSTEFSTGNRIEIIAMGLRKNYWFKSEVLRLDGETDLTRDPCHQYYTVVGNELRLVYLEIDDHVYSNSYTDPRLTVGPRLNLSAGDWEADLQSTDDARVLSALIWLGGDHWNGQEAPYDEDRADAEKVTSLRARDSVRRRLADLTNSKNYFIKNTAEAIAKQ